MARLSPAQREALDLLRDAETHRRRALGSMVTCPDCSGTGTVPMGGGEPDDEVDNGYVKCPTCDGHGAV